MKYFKIVAIIAVAAVIFVMPEISSAQTVADLQAQLNSLLAQVQQLQAQLAQIQGTTQWCHDFNVNLKVGDSGDEVVALQTVLAKEDFGAGSGGKNTGYFGETTASAVSGFQQKYKDEILTPLGLKYGTGYVGEKTRAKLNSLYGCNSTATPIITPPCPPATIICDAGYERAYDFTDTKGCPQYKCVNIVAATTTPSITVLSPNGGESWQVGQTYEIKWKTNLTNSSGLVVIDLLDFNRTDPEQYPVQLIGTVPDTGSYQWTISSSLGLGGSNYKIKITDFKEIGPSVKDFSDAPFSIVAVGTSSVTVQTSPDTPPSKTVNYGTTNVELLRFNLSASGDSDIQISGIAIEYYSQVYGEILPASALSNLKIFDGATQYGSTVSIISSGSDTLSNSSCSNKTSYTWFYGNLIIPKGTTKTLRLVANIPLLPGVNSITAIIPSWTSSCGLFKNGISDHFVARIVGTQTAPSLTGEAFGTTQYLRNAGTAGSLSISSSPVTSPQALKGSLGATLAKFNFAVGSEESIAISKVSFRIDRDVTDGAAAIQSGDLMNIKLMDGSTQIGSTVAAVVESAINTPNVTFSGLNLIIPAGTTKTLEIKGDISSVTTAKNFETAIYSGYVANWIDSQGVSFSVNITETGGGGWLVNIITPSITVLSPNGGETWKIGGTYIIKWNNTTGKNVSIEVTGNRGNDSLVMGTFPPSQISRDFTVPTSWQAGSDFKVKVSAFDGSSSDSSDAPFSVAAAGLPPVIKSITGPSNLGNFETGTWTVQANDPVGGPLTYQVAYYPSSWTGTPKFDNFVPPSFSHVFGDPNNYTLIFKVIGNNGLSAELSKYVKVGNIITPSITVLSPNGGEVWGLGTTKNINWSLSGFDSNQSVKLELWDAGITKMVGTICNSCVPGTLAWVVGNLLDTNGNFFQATPGQYRVHAIPIGSSSGDMSDAPFSIVAATTTPSITVLSPNGGEHWEIGKTYQVSWQSTNAPSDGWVRRIQLRRASDDALIIDGIVPDGTPFSTAGSVQWKIPDNIGLLSGNYKIKIHLYRGVLGSEILLASDTSDAPFSIVAATTTPSINGACGTTLNACASGTLNDTTDSNTQYLWACNGSNGGTNASCSLPKPVNGMCGMTLNTCATGTFNDIADSSTQYLWNCTGTNSGTTANCSANKQSSGFPDLKVTKFYPPSSASKGKAFSASLTIQNNGNASAGSFTVKIYFSAYGTFDDRGQVLGTYNVSSLGAGQSLSFAMLNLMFTDASIHSYYYLYAVVDADYQVTESDEGNNVFRREILIL